MRELSMSKWTTWILVLFISLVPLAAQAQTAVTNLSEAQVDLWPDLDRPSVLVLITASLPDDTTYPATVRFMLPTEPNAVASITADGQMLNAPFQTLSEDDAYLIEVETSEPIVRVEYYFPYSREGDNVDFSYQWLGGPAVDSLVLMFREPSMATAVDPDARFELIGTLPDGQSYHQWDVGAVGPDETITADFAYVAPPAIVQSVSSTGTAAPVQEASSSTLPVVLAAAGGLLLGVGLGWALSRQRRAVRRVSQRARTAQAAYCHECGARLRSGDAFCRQCGTKLR
jgi:hypothetical protein